VREVLDDDVVGAYLHGSAVLGGLRPKSDLDVMVVSRRGMSPERKRRLIERLLEVSLRPRPVEVTIVVADEIRPWRYPPAMEFQFGDWWRREFERGEMEPWTSPSPDLAVVIRMVVLGDAPLSGPPAAEVFDPVPRADFVDALVHGIDGLLAELGSDTRNVVLTLARIWSGIETDQILSKDAAAQWALLRLPEHLRPVLAHARDVYLGRGEDRWGDFGPVIRAYAEFLVMEIRRARSEDRTR
jgi:predicted nucleotidyltransferase